MANKPKIELPEIGWREWVRIPDWGISRSQQLSEELGSSVTVVDPSED